MADLNQLIVEYQEIRKKHGNKAKNTNWLKKNGYGWLYQQVWGKYNLFWHEFKKRAGFDDETSKKGLSENDLISEYQKIRKKYGDKAKSTLWLRKNGYGWIEDQSNRKHNLSWNDFKKKAEFDDEPFRRNLSEDDLISEYQKIRGKYGDKAKNTAWIRDHGYGWLNAQIYSMFKSWYEFKKKAGFDDEHPCQKTYSLDSLVSEYIKIRKKQGKKAMKVGWLNDNGYSWIVRQIRKIYNLSWYDFKKLAGFNEGSKKNLSEKDLIALYQQIRKVHGDKAKSTIWLNKNCYSGLCARFLKCNPWNEFKKKAGFDDDEAHKKGFTLDNLIEEYQKVRAEHGEKTKSCQWLIKNGYGWLYSQVKVKYNLGWNCFKKLAGFDEEPCKRKGITLDDLIIRYQKVRKEYGDKAKTTEWLKDHGYKWLYAQINMKHGLSWYEFKIKAGFNDSYLRETFKSIGFSESAIKRLMDAIKENEE